MGPDQTNSNALLFRAGLFAALAATLTAIALSPAVVESGFLATATAIDIVFTLPVVYFFIIRRTSVPRITVVPVFFTCVFSAWAILPDVHRDFLNIVIMFGLPAVELFVLGYLGYRILRTRRAYLEGHLAGHDFLENLRAAFVRELKPPFIARAAAFELSIIAYAFFKWKAPDGSGFSYHRRMGAQTLLIVFLGLLIAETFIAHVLVAMWSPLVAWLITAITIYFAVQVFAHLKALRLRPIIVNDSEIRLRCGILSDAVVERDLILDVEKILPTSANDGDAYDMLPLGRMSQPNVSIDLLEPVSCFGIYGIEKQSLSIRIAIDEPEHFIETLTSAS